ncbi:MAG: hypothetical protein GY906_37055 [bacterium]|nr:hypothetical protein [bacterium]
MAPKPQTIQPESQATPLSGDVLDLLRRELAQGSQVATPLQRQAGTNISQFINEGGGEFNLSPLFSALTETFGQQNQQALAQLNESFSIGGGRFGTGNQTAQGRFLAEAVPRQEAVLGNIGLQSFNDQMSRLLQAIGLQSNIGAQGFAPFLQLAGQGIIPEQTFLQQNPIVSGLGALSGAAQGVGSVLGGLPPGLPSIIPGGIGNQAQVTNPLEGTLVGQQNPFQGGTI